MRDKAIPGYSKAHATAPPAGVRRIDQYSSRALEKGLQALEELSQAPQGLTLAEVAGKLALSKPSAFRIVRTLENLGHVAKAADGGYRLAGVSSREVPARSAEALRREGSGPLRELMSEFRETASLAALFENHIEVILVFESPQPVRMTNTLGRILPPHASSLGKAIAAFLDRATREHLLQTYGTAAITPHTVTDELALAKEFKRIRKQGYAEDREESTSGGVCFGCPILRDGSVPVGAISVSMPKMRLSGEKSQRRIVAAVRAAAAETASRAFRNVG